MGSQTLSSEAVGVPCFNWFKMNAPARAALASTCTAWTVPKKTPGAHHCRIALSRSHLRNLSLSISICFLFSYSCQRDWEANKFRFLKIRLSFASALPFIKWVNCLNKRKNTQQKKTAPFLCERKFTQPSRKKQTNCNLSWSQPCSYEKCTCKKYAASNCKPANNSGKKTHAHTFTHTHTNFTRSLWKRRAGQKIWKKIEKQKQKWMKCTCKSLGSVASVGWAVVCWGRSRWWSPLGRNGAPGQNGPLVIPIPRGAGLVPLEFQPRRPVIGRRPLWRHFRVTLGLLA